MQQSFLTKLCHISCVCAYDSIRFQLNAQAFLVIYLGTPYIQLKQRMTCPKKHTIIQQNHLYLGQEKAVECPQPVKLVSIALNMHNKQRFGSQYCDSEGTSKTIKNKQTQHDTQLWNDILKATEGTLNLLKFFSRS